MGTKRRLLKRIGGGTIRAMGKEESDKYLGVAQSQVIDRAEMKQVLIEQLRSRLTALMKTQLFARNKAKATNSYLILAVGYGLESSNGTCLSWRTCCTIYSKFRAHHPKACKERFHLPRNAGGRGIIDMKLLYKERVT